MTRRYAVSLTDEQEAMLEQLAREHGEPPEQLAAQAVEEWLKYEIAFRQAVDEGLADAEAGRLYSAEEVKAHFEAKAAANRNDAAE